MIREGKKEGINLNMVDLMVGLSFKNAVHFKFSLIANVLPLDHFNNVCLNLIYLTGTVELFQHELKLQIKSVYVYQLYSKSLCDSTRSYN